VPPARRPRARRASSRRPTGPAPRRSPAAGARARTARPTRPGPRPARIVATATRIRGAVAAAWETAWSAAAVSLWQGSEEP
jgi:hypothetical protein